MQRNKSLNQTNNALVYAKRSKTIYLGQVTKQGLQIRKFYLNNKENSSRQNQSQPIVLGYYKKT